MNFVQQFLEEHLSKQLNHQLLQIIQHENSAVQSLVNNLESLRSDQCYVKIQDKVQRIQNFIELQKQIIFQFQSVDSSSGLFDWLLNNFLQNRLLYEIAQKQKFYIQKQLIQIGRSTLFEANFQKQHLQNIQLGRKTINQLHQMSDSKNSSSKKLNRQKIKHIDLFQQDFQLKIKNLDDKVINFNKEVQFFMKKFSSFQEKVMSEFRSHFSGGSSRVSKVQTPKVVKQQKPYNRNHSLKSHLSLNSQENVFGTNYEINRRSSINAHTPRKSLQSPAKPYQNRKSSIIYGKSQIEKLMEGQDLRNMNKTLSSFNHYRPAQISDLMYTTTDFGGQVRLPSKWTGNNTRSSISYYPLR